MILKSRTILAVFGITMLSITVNAETPTVNPDFIKLKKSRNQNDSPIRGRVPAMNVWLSVEINNGVLIFEFPEDAEAGVVTIGTGDFTVFSAAIDRTDNSVEIPPLSGNFLLTATFDNGDEYEGEITL